MASTKRAYALTLHVFSVISKKIAKQVPEVSPHHDAARELELEEIVGRYADSGY